MGEKGWKCTVCQNDEYDLGYIHNHDSYGRYKSINTKNPLDMRSSDPKVHACICLKCGGMQTYVLPHELKAYLDKEKIK